MKANKQKDKQDDKKTKQKKHNALLATAGATITV